MADEYLEHAIDPPAERAVVFVCRKCGEKLGGRGEKSPSERLRSRLKKLAKSELPKKSVRVTLVDCLDVCPKKRILVGVARTGIGTVYLTLPPAELDDFAQHLIDGFK